MFAASMVGIDVSKASLQCALVDASSQKLVWEMTIDNSPEGIAKLTRRAGTSVPWVVEPTGRYSLLVAQTAQQEERRVLLAQPRKAKAFLNSLQSRAKTDKLDARGLALFGLSRPLCDYPVKTAVHDELDQLLTARKGMSHSLTSLRQRSKELPDVQCLLAPALLVLEKQIAETDKRIAALTKNTPEFEGVRRLRKVPGIGPVTSAAVISRLSARTFSRPDKFVAYIGLDVGVVQSGNRQGQRGLTKQGDAELRRLLYLAAKSNLRCKDSTFREQFERELGKGMSKTAALNAVARKLARVCWSLHRHSTEYDPTRVYVQPTTAQSQEAPDQTTGQ